MAAAVCMKEYLKRYQSDSDAEEANKKAENPKSSALGGLTVIDDDAVWTTKGRDSPGGEQAQVKRGKGVKRRAKKGYNSLSKEGSSSVSSSGSSPQNSGDLYPPRQRRKCLKTTSPDHHFWVGVSEESSGEKKTDRVDRHFWVGLSQESSREKKMDRADRHFSVGLSQESSGEKKVVERKKEVVRPGGLFSNEEFREQNRKRKELERSRIMLLLTDPSISGKGAQPVFRDRRGRKITKEDMSKEKPKKVN